MLIQSRSVAATASDFHRFVLCKGDGLWLLFDAKIAINVKIFIGV
jgi:hypothetical protein